MTQVILVVGCTGAGKTTYARTLADERGAIRFSIDEWMMPLFGPDIPEPMRFDWMMERVNRCEAMIFAMTQQVAARGLPVVLDLGFTKAAHRDKFRALCGEAGLSVSVHFVDVLRETRWRGLLDKLHRGHRRNQPMFDFSTERIGHHDLSDSQRAPFEKSRSFGRLRL